MKFQLSPRAALLIIAALFLLPLLSAWLMYSGVIDYQPISTRNYGTLVEPPVPVDLQELGVRPLDGRSFEELDEHWTVLHVVPAECPETCLQAITSLRQVHRSAGRNQKRIRLLLLLQQPVADAIVQKLHSIYPSFLLAADESEQLEPMLARLAVAGGGKQAIPGSTYLIDPIGNIMMHYGPESDPNDLKSDLKRLLTWSKLDEQ